MRYELFRMGRTRQDDRYLAYATTLDNARRRAMELYTGKTIVIRRISVSGDTDCGYIAMNSDGFYYNNLERHIKQSVRSNGTLVYR